MKAKTTCILSLLLVIFFLSPINAFAQLFGADDEDLAKIEFELKKFNTHLENLKNTQIKSLKGQQEDLLRQIEEIKQILPQVQGSIDQNKAETLSSLEKTISIIKDLEAEVKNQVLEKIQQQNNNLELFRKEQENLKVGLAQDIEKFEQSSRANFQEFAKANEETFSKVIQQLEAQSATTKKGFDDTIALFRTEVIPKMVEENEKNRKLVLERLAQASAETQKMLEAFFTKNQEVNQKLRKILQESLKQGLDTKSLLDSIKKSLGVTDANLVGVKQDIVSNHSAISEVHKAVSIANKNLLINDEKNNKLAESLKALQTQNTASNSMLTAFKADLEHAGEFNKLADEKFNKLIDLSTELAIHSTELESSVVAQLKDSAQKRDASNTKVDLANEKLSRLIEILKAIAKEQEKLGPVTTALGNMQKEQATLQKTQEDLKKNQKQIQANLKKNQKEIKEALADLRRKANVNISRGDDIKKALGKLNSAKK
jgi:chromosome segregation ATPase